MYLEDRLAQDPPLLDAVTKQPTRPVSNKAGKKDLANSKLRFCSSSYHFLLNCGELAWLLEADNAFRRRSNPSCIQRLQISQGGRLKWLKLA